MRKSIYSAAFISLFLSGLIACTQKESPQQLRDETAQATADAKSDAKALADGVKEGWNRDRRLNLNTASRRDLLGLPGMSDADADHVIAARLYQDTDELISKHVVSRTEYDRISDRVTAK